MISPDDVKIKLLELDNLVEDFNVIYTGKESKKVDGLYKPEPREILIHNRNFKSDNELIYTAIHEFAHHIQFTRSTKKVSSRAHTVQFWDIFHRLLFDAEDKGIFINPFKDNPEFAALTANIKSKFLTENGQLMKDFGAMLLEAMSLCSKHNASFEDYVDRELGLHRTTAKSIMNTFRMDVNPDIGFDNMKYVAGIKDEHTREMAEVAFLKGKSPDMVKAEFSPGRRNDVDENSIEFLESEKRKIKKKLDELADRLSKIDDKIVKIRIKGSNDESQSTLM